MNLVRRRSILVPLCASLGALCPAAASAAQVDPTVLVLPFETEAGAHRDLGFGVELSALGALRAMGHVNVIHPKIRQAVLQRHGEQTKDWSRGRRRAAYARYVGASWTLEGAVGAKEIVLRLARLGTCYRILDRRAWASCNLICSTRCG